MAGRKMTQFEALMTAINGIQTEVAGIRADVDALKGKTATKKTDTKTTAKQTTKKGSAKKTAKKQTEKVQTWTEKKAEYAKQFSDEERAEYGFRKSLERKGQKFAFEYTNAQFDERVDRKVWKKAYNENLGYIMNVIEDLVTCGEAYTEEEVCLEFLKTVDATKKTRSDVKGMAKFVRA